MLDQTTLIKPCDLFFARGHSFTSDAVRFFSWGWGQPYPKCSHVGGFYAGRNVYYGQVVEALNKVEAHSFLQQYKGTGTEICIYRPINLTLAQKSHILQAALSTVGESYGYMRIGLHLLDSLLLGANVFRRLGGNQKPICSWVWAHAFKAAGLDFGCDEDVAQPDDMYDFCEANPDKYQPITRGFELI